MNNKKTKRRLRSVVTWILWVLLAQLILINISAALYAYKLTHLYTPTSETWTKPVSNNIFARTWRLFTGPKFYKQTLAGLPGFPFSAIILKTKNDISIEAWYGKTDSVPKGTVILFHGLMGHKGLVLDEANAFRNLGFNVMMVDVRDHGNSGGTITTIGYKESEEVKLAYDHLMQMGEKNVFLWGPSLGAVEIIKAVSDYHLQPSGIIIEMPFLSLQSHLKGRARIEWYDFYIFGMLATTIADQFFPKGNPTAALLSTLAIFAAGFIVRPFGALVFGRLGDLIGRKYTFLLTLVLMGGSIVVASIPKI